MKKTNKKKIKLPKNFFQKVRPTVSNEETFKDVVPIKWNTESITSPNKVIAFSPKNSKFSKTN